MPDTDTYPAPDSDTEDPWLSIGETARLMGLSRETLRRYDASGVLKASRSPGGQRRYRRSQVDRAMRHGEVAAAPASVAPA